jgi:ABC-type nitrate/sulfonate/bicarbonate transport system substrate-binding protein
MTTTVRLLKLRCVVFLAVALAFAIPISAIAPEQVPQKIRVLCLNRPLPVVLAQSNGILAKYGIEVEFMTLPSSDVLRSDLESGKGDVAFLALDNDVALVDSAGADAVIVMGGESSLNEIIAQPGIRSIADLRGRTLIVDAPNTAYALQLKKVLLMNGLQAGRDFAIKPVGATTLRLQGMREHPEYAAAVLNPPFSILARHDGMISLGSMRTLLGFDMDRGTFVMRAWAREHADLLTRYLAAYVEAQRDLLAPANKQQVISLVMKEPNLSAPLATEWYAGVIQNDGYAPDARFDMEAFKKALILRAEVEPGGARKTPAAEKYYDLSYYQAALSRIK